MTTDDESGLSQLRQQIQALPTFSPSYIDPGDMVADWANDAEWVRKQAVLKLVEAASEKYRQSRKPLTDNRQSELESIRNEIISMYEFWRGFGPLKGVISLKLQETTIVGIINTRIKADAKPAATIQGKAESDST